MKCIKLILSLSFLTLTLLSYGQVENAGTVRKRTEQEIKEKKSPGEITSRMQGLYKDNETHDADLSYMKEVYRKLELDKGSNAALYYPEDVIEGQENLFRIIFNQVVNGNLPAYEYLDGKEIFTDQYKVNVGDLLERFDIYFQQGKGSNEKNPKFIIEEADVPAGQVKNYYILEKWTFDTRSNVMKTTIEAVCPVLNRYGDYGEETKYPMFWVKFDSLRPFLVNHFVFVNDDNNLPEYSLDDFFSLGLYDGEIYKTRNLRNLSMSQMYTDEDDMKRAQDSIDYHLRHYGKNLWVPSREEYLASKKANKEGEITDETVVTENDLSRKIENEKSVSSRSSKKNARRNKKLKVSSSSTSSSVEKSVRRRKKGS